jgi:hypothetical protein
VLPVARFFQTKNPNLGKFGKALDGKMCIFMAIWNILQTFGIFYDIWYLLCSFGTFFGFGFMKHKNLATLFHSCSSKEPVQVLLNYFCRHLDMIVEDC